MSHDWVELRWCDGLITRRCSRCGLKQARKHPVVNHQWNNGPIQNGPGPRCTGRAPGSGGKEEKP